MSFYLKPPKGLINLPVLTECVNQRIKCYDFIADNIEMNTIENFEYLIEDSILDRVGHFIFRLAAFSGALPKDIFINNEVYILQKRIDCFNKSDLMYFLEKIIRQLRDCIRFNLEQYLSDFYWNLYKTCIKMLEKDYLQCIFGKLLSQEHDFTQKSILVPFQYCCNFVRTRSIYLKNGFVYFEPTEWKNVLLTLYSSFLKLSLKEMKYSQNVSKALIDDRISNCLKVLKEKYSPDIFSYSNKMNLNNLESNSIYFPLCMKNLQNTLKEKHRLAHHDRYNFSIFLKEIGLSMEDSMRFWQGEYSKEQASCAKCSHSWKENEKKYRYSIRHLYGLEGSLKNYKMRSCSYFQSPLGVNTEGVCPFVHYDDNFLRSYLKKSLPTNLGDEIEIMIYERKENPATSCKLFCKAAMGAINLNKQSDECLQLLDFNNPLEYYLQMKSKDI